MAVHVVLDRDQIRSILSLYHLDQLEDFGGIAEGSINTSYWVVVDGRKYFLRITEKKRIDDMIYEKELLLHMQRSGMSVPRLIKNVARGTFTPWATRGRYVSLFDYMPGRELGIFEVRPRHVRMVGQYLARMHVATQTFTRSRSNEFSMDALEQRMERLVRGIEKKRLARRFEPDVRLLWAEIDRQKRRRVDHLRRGTVHGDMFIDNAKFLDDELIGVIDFEMSSSERLLWDVAVTLNDWCWQPTAKQQGGPNGRFHVGRVRSFLTGYDRLRPLTAPERRALPGELRLAAARFAITRLIDFELRRAPAGQRIYKDYRHFTARLLALSNGGAEMLVERVLG